MYVDLLVFLEPGVHLTELDLDEPIELVVMIDGRRRLRAPAPDDDVVDMVLLGLKSVGEVLVGDVLCLEEVIGVVWLEPATQGPGSDGVGGR